MEREMDCKTLMGVAKVTGVSVSMAFDPYAEPAKAWAITIGDHVQGRGATPESALDEAVAALESHEREPVALG